MSVIEDIVLHKKYRIWDEIANKWKRYSFWSKASDVELNDGTDVESAISALNLSLSRDEGEITTLQENVVWYGTSTTSSSTTSKVATTNDSKFELVTGAKVCIKFTSTNTVSSPTLNVDSKGAKYIKAYGTTTPTVWWKAGDVVDFVYDGTYWIMGATEGQITQLNSDLTNIHTISGTTTQYGNIATSYDYRDYHIIALNAYATGFQPVESLYPIVRVMNDNKLGFHVYSDDVNPVVKGNFNVTVNFLLIPN